MSIEASRGLSSNCLRGGEASRKRARGHFSQNPPRFSRSSPLSGVVLDIVRNQAARDFHDPEGCLSTTPIFSQGPRHVDEMLRQTQGADAPALATQHHKWAGPDTLAPRRGASPNRRKRPSRGLQQGRAQNEAWHLVHGQRARHGPRTMPARSPATYLARGRRHPRRRPRMAIPRGVQSQDGEVRQHARRRGDKVAAQSASAASAMHDCARAQVWQPAGTRNVSATSATPWTRRHWRRGRLKPLGERQATALFWRPRWPGAEPGSHSGIWWSLRNRFSPALFGQRVKGPGRFVRRASLCGSRCPRWCQATGQRRSSAHPNPILVRTPISPILAHLAATARTPQTTGLKGLHNRRRQGPPVSCHNNPLQRPNTVTGRRRGVRAVMADGKQAAWHVNRAAFLSMLPARVTVHPP